MLQSARIESTADGSPTLYIPELDEHYHSVNGAIQESKHVFIDAGLRPIAQKSKNISVLEIGFGTGLNALLTLLEGKKLNLNIHYTTLELYPLPLNLAEQLNYPEVLQTKDENLFINLHQAEWGKVVEITPNFTLHKIETDFSKPNFETGNEAFNLIYLDAFAPNKQNGVWTQTVFNRLFGKTIQGGILTTYCAKGIVRRMMQQAGYTVERLPGPPGKREMLRAFRPGG
ncbi:tRNA U34 5-methylaminomethyl-2-thiouridine-forming methyltransferase MnmC [Dysgonomonas sp. PH5-45]|uniref:tRNA (5-methylaminomethyl-2-thiouridine)(34)-methyltransferase MnmD n=1 Tax=unclassified Dysgonomonas TaxID=2630389 RepID=UPI00247433E8|nr:MULTISPECIES: tRNA (5-methylaminomethyl-2-thiouridine)(34)-methyltransferase MnmD [unclassified Dysgonomonas]MDH6354033.1 tRNA U34 5-methylaminomethyl-2-thiouridine-forming methyltransferase MnmC [Dysgonomonas sp. PH5-45]MDH6386935.1 tRNA U34 5-methylaminomethyl-2-thiouridine-forming methyltransferase MnmC [Dysgonomonas sp. PH5-37]